MLVKLGYRVTRAASGPEAIAMAREHPDIDLLFTDVVMPGGLSGPDVALAVGRLLPRVVVLYTSGYTGNALARFGKQELEKSLLSKPYRLQDLALKLRQVLPESGAQPRL